MNTLTKYLVLIALIAVASFSIATEAAVKLPRLISDGMVLQRDVPLKVWGWADSGEKIKIEFLGETYRARADQHGNWKVELPATAAGGPYIMKINEIEIHDILIGDVWLCSGQSNMELPIRRVMDLYEKEILRVNNSKIRQFRSSSRNDFPNPQKDFKDGAWMKAIPENITDFSAVAYFFADNLYQTHKIPIGLINTAIGGSPAESWLSETNVNKYMENWRIAQARIDSMQTKRKSAGSENTFNFFTELNQSDPGVSNWSKAYVNVTGWSKISLPGFWSDKGVEMQNGSIWFYKEFVIPDSLANKNAILRLGRIIDSDSAFVNGTFVGTVSYQYPPRIYKLPVGVLKPGINKLMVRVISQGGKGGFVEEKPYEVRVGSQVIDLTGEWNYHTGAMLKSSLGAGGGLQFNPGGLYNGLISPVLSYKLKGVIWYQGESNTGRGKEYRQLFQDLINDWRSQFAQADLPFLFAQLPNYGIPNKQPAESGWAEIRDAQRRALGLPNTGMAITYDIGEWNDIHPINKKEVARRLALEASRVAYHDSTTVSSGPLFVSKEIKDKYMILKFKSVGSGLFTNSHLEGFQIASSDGHFEWANAVVLSETTVRVWSENVIRPTIVRYAWDDNPAGANLKNKEGLLASPFTTAD